MHFESLNGCLAYFQYVQPEALLVVSKATFAHIIICIGTCADRASIRCDTHLMREGNA